ncbi:RusA family crossover junction endodeoxyribonuclease [Metapseudomonas otitidis]|uniref:RusA family crossover junction endodeoxyribonuclease n=1 Tax=Metapseudomonas otitidis TaxID=319939 RepID=UPI00244ABE56|nr:RusA family crossover junction endodeoxyribonuclease [Pseudomonas otitidis]MDG9784656.1 RusA family crossover junction endodeoxyribonuclease [Pseudomonas otitidis]
MNSLRIIEFFVPGEPVGKGRPRLSTHAGLPRMHSTAKSIAYEGLIAHAGSQAMAGEALIEGPVLVEIYMGLSMPQSMSKKRRAQALAGLIFPTKRPDMDNVIKAIFDGLNGVTWVDDVQVVDSVVRKRYAEVPGVKVRVVPLYTTDHMEAKAV